MSEIVENVIEDISEGGKNLNNSIRRNFLDVAKGIVIVLMIIGHTRAPKEVIIFIYGFHMPFFFIMSGYLYNKEKWEQIGIRELIFKKFKAYIVPYFCFSFLNLLINIPAEYYIEGIRGKELINSTINHIYWIFYSLGGAKATPNCTPLWFLPCLFVCNIYIFLLFKVKRNSIRVFICLVAIIIDMLLSYYNVGQLPWHIETALLGMVFMLIGYEINRKELLNSKHLDWSMVSVIAAMGVYCIFSNSRVDINSNVINNVVLLYIGAIAISFILLWICMRYLAECRFFAYLGRNTIIFLAFNYAINKYSRFVWVEILLLREVLYTWLLESIVNIVVCVALIYIRDTVRAKVPK